MPAVTCEMFWHLRLWIAAIVLTLSLWGLPVIAAFGMDAPPFEPPGQAPAIIEKFLAKHVSSKHHVWVINAVTREKDGGLVLDINVLLDGTNERRFLLLTAGQVILAAQEVQLDGTLCTPDKET